MEKKLITININKFPIELRKYLLESNIYDSSSFSSAKVYYLDNGYYLKVGLKDSLKLQYELTNLYYSLNLGPKVELYLQDNLDYLLTEAANGDDLLSLINNPLKLCKICAKALNKLHNLKINQNIPSKKIDKLFDFKNRYNINEQYLISPIKFDSYKDIIDTIKNNIQKMSFNTFIHGDACLPNIINNADEIYFIDVGDSGLGDKHIDIYWTIWSLEYNLKTSKYTDVFLESYGKDKIDFEVLKLVTALEMLE